MDLRAFHEGRCFDAYETLGCHVRDGGAAFRVYAPNARAVAVIGEFNGWRETPMARSEDGGFWTCDIPGARPGMLYKYRVTRADGWVADHCDPFGFGMELRPCSGSVIRDPSAYRFHDGDWMARRSDGKGGPVNIYEVHAGSWMRHTWDGNRWYSYETLADALIPYVREQGYNYIELMPLAEHPLDGSWGYQITCPYSPTSRYGTADQLKAFVDRCHQANLGVLLDFVPSHFAVDDYGLAAFDGTALYEYPDERADSEWGSKNFNLSRGDVRSYLQSNAHYWLKEYHFDGLRMDAVRNVLYLNGDARRENPDGAAFLRHMNRGLKALHPTAMLIAEDSTTRPGCTKPVEEGGLGFDYKWNLGWMHDTLDFMAAGFDRRRAEGGRLTFSMHYFYDERYLLPLSHDEAAHGKGTVAGRMAGDYETRFRQARLLYAYMITHPGKKLSFMGNEFAQLREWDPQREQDWNLLSFPIHAAFNRCLRELNRLYLSIPALSAWDDDPRGFQWIVRREADCLYAYARTDGRQRVLAFLNFSDQPQVCRLSDDHLRGLRLLVDTDAREFGGESRAEPWIELRDGSADVPLPPVSARVYLAQSM